MKFCKCILLTFIFTSVLFFFLPFGETAVAQPKDFWLRHYKSWERKSTNIKKLLVSVVVKEVLNKH